MSAAAWLGRWLWPVAAMHGFYLPPPDDPELAAGHPRLHEPFLERRKRAPRRLRHALAPLPAQRKER